MPGPKDQDRSRVKPEALRRDNVTTSVTASFGFETDGVHDMHDLPDVHYCFIDTAFLYHHNSQWP